MEKMEGMASSTGTLLVIVTGAPATGKTTAGKRIAESLRLPYIYKDGIKEILFDTLGWKDREWSKRLGGASMELLFHLVEAQLQADRSCVVEGNFYPEFHASKFLALKHKYLFEPFQVLCRAEPAMLAERYKERVISGERHPGHVDHVLSEELDPIAMLEKHVTLPIGGQVFTLDTSDFGAIDFDGLFQALAAVGFQGS